MAIDQVDRTVVTQERPPVAGQTAAPPIRQDTPKASDDLILRTREGSGVSFLTSGEDVVAVVLDLHDDAAKVLAELTAIGDLGDDVRREVPTKPLVARPVDWSP